MSDQSRASVMAAEPDAPLDEERAIWRRRLLAELGSVTTQPRAQAPMDDTYEEPKVDVADQQALDLERDVDLLLDDGSGAAAEAIREALDRLDQGSFGRCVDCDETIAIARLTALPYAARCLDCQSRAERRR